MRLLLVTPSGSYRAGDFLEAARAMGCEVLVASDAVSVIPGAFTRISFDDPVAAAKRLIEKLGVVDGVVGTDGAAIAVAAETARLLGRSANPAEALVTAESKYLQRQAAEAAGVSQPAFALISGEARPLWSTFPAVVKPVDRGASQGVLRVDSPRELDEAVGAVRAIVGRDALLLVEAFVAGVEVAVEGLVGDGQLVVLAVFDKPDDPQGPTFPETLLISPARLEPEALRRLMAVAQRAVAAIGLVEGPVHVECKVDSEDVWFLELAARTIGGLCSRALNCGGMSLEEVVIRRALGLPTPTPTPTPDPAATGVLMLPVDDTGHLEAVRGVQGARTVEGVTDVVISIAAGERVVALPAGDRYLGFVFARARTADQAEAALRAAWAHITVQITAS